MDHSRGDGLENGSPMTPEPTTAVTARTILAIPVVPRIAAGWAAVALLVLVPGLIEPSMSSVSLALVLAAIVAVIAYCAFGVVHQAEHLARRLGDPYGSLVLTLSIVIIEVVLISAVMLGPGESSTIARDSVMAVSMVILNLVVGLSLLLGALRHGHLRLNRAGSSTYLAMLIVLTTFALILPGVIGVDGAYTGAQQVVVVGVTIAMYVFFLLRQTTTEASNYREAPSVLADTGVTPQDRSAGPSPDVVRVIRENAREVLTRAAVLVITVVPIVLLSHDMAVLLDEGLDRSDAPVALTGLLIAMIVFLPEAITSLRAGLAAQAQRVMNLGHGALVSTVGLTIPAVLVIGALTGQTVILGESLPHIVLLAVSILLGINTILAERITAGHGAAHLAMFVAYGMTLFG